MDSPPARDLNVGLPRFLEGRDEHTVRLLATGPKAFSAIQALAARAEREILLACYIVADDEVGTAVEETLTAAASRGVSVKVLVDGVGSLAIAHDPWPNLRAAGGRVEVHAPVAPWRRRWGLWRRDHRKMFVVDGRTAILGGMNIAREYALPIEQGGIVDRAVEIEGPSVSRLTHLFDRTWSYVTGERPGRRELAPPAPGGRSIVAIEGNGRILDRHRIGRAYREGIREARRSIVLENPYFLPGSGIRRLLRNAVRRGVSVRIVLPERTDARLVDLASRATWGRLAQAGIALSIDPAFLHAKIAVFDETRVLIGSCNLDHRSLFENLEVVAFVEDEAFAREILVEIEKDVARARPFDLAAWKNRPPLERWAQHAMFALRVWW